MRNLEESDIYRASVALEYYYSKINLIMEQKGNSG
jgi:hypothetical protein